MHEDDEHDVIDARQCSETEPAHDDLRTNQLDAAGGELDCDLMILLAAIARLREYLRDDADLREMETAFFIADQCAQHVHRLCHAASPSMRSDVRKPVRPS